MVFHGLFIYFLRLCFLGFIFFDIAGARTNELDGVLNKAEVEYMVSQVETTFSRRRALEFSGICSE
jgi:hypothetical protein